MTVVKFCQAGAGCWADSVSSLEPVTAGQGSQHELRPFPANLSVCLHLTEILKSKILQLGAAAPGSDFFNPRPHTRLLEDGCRSKTSLGPTIKTVRKT